MAYYTDLNAPKCPWCKNNHYNHDSCKREQELKLEKQKQQQQDKEELAKMIAKEIVELLKK